MCIRAARRIFFRRNDSLNPRAAFSVTDMERLWGRIAPVPEDRLRVLNDGDVVPIGPLEVRAIATPGHASHHHVYHWDENLFGGDVAGVRLGKGPPIPPFVPPELDVEAWLDSINKMRRLERGETLFAALRIDAGFVRRAL